MDRLDEQIWVQILLVKIVDAYVQISNVDCFASTCRKWSKTMAELSHWPSDRVEQNSILTHHQHHGILPNRESSDLPFSVSCAPTVLPFARVYSCLCIPACYGEGGG